MVDVVSNLWRNIVKPIPRHLLFDWRDLTRLQGGEGGFNSIVQRWGAKYNKIKAVNKSQVSENEESVLCHVKGCLVWVKVKAEYVAGVREPREMSTSGLSLPRVTSWYTRLSLFCQMNVEIKLEAISRGETGARAVSLCFSVDVVPSPRRISVWSNPPVLLYRQMTCLSKCRLCIRVSMYVEAFRMPSWVT